MSITYTWKITGIKIQDQYGNKDSVVQTYWTKTGIDELGNTGLFNGATPFSTNNISQESFIPFDQLTEEIVLGWIKDIVVGPYEEHVNNQIQKQIDSKRTPIVDTPLPWAPQQE